MPDWAIQYGAQRYQTNGMATSAMTLLTASATINTELAWPQTQLVAATSYDYDGIIVHIGAGTVVAAEHLIDIAVGASGAELMLIENLQASSSSSASTAVPTDSIYVPLCVPSGSRISARTQSAVASGNVRIAVTGIQGTLAGRAGGLGKCTTYGATTATSRGTSIDAGATANTKGAWSVLSASTTDDIAWLVIKLGNQGVAVRTQANFQYDIGVGGAGAEVVVVADLPMVVNSTIDLPQPAYVSIPCSIAKGSRLVARAACSSNVAAVRVFDMAVYGIA